MAISGSNYIEYETVAANAISTFALGQISGGGEGSGTVVGGASFNWTYDPDLTSGNGFTGNGWFCGVPNTPLAGITEESLIDQFNNQGRTNLDDYFKNWQSVVDNQPEGSDYVHDFMEKVGWDCFSMV